MPLKLKVFLWLAFSEKLQMGFTLKKKERKGKENRIFCGVPKQSTVNHVFFQCFLSLHSFNWCCFKETLGRDRIPDFPVSMRICMIPWLCLGAENYGHKLLFAIVVCSIWSLDYQKPNEYWTCLSKFVNWSPLQNLGFCAQMAGFQNALLIIHLATFKRESEPRRGV